MKIRIRFRKYGVMKFIGHLDLMRFFQKAIRRSGINIAYSEGFSPHQIMSFAAPLGVGLTSDGEYVDIEVHTSPSSKEAIAALNAVMTEGIEITGYVQLPDQAKTAMSIVSAADYQIFYKEAYTCPLDLESLKAQLSLFYKEPDQILVTKKTKKKESLIDIKPLIYQFHLIAPTKESGDKPIYAMSLASGSANNLKPDLVLEAFYRFLGQEYSAFAFQIHRKDLYYTDSKGGRHPLLEAGKLIP